MNNSPNVRYRNRSWFGIDRARCQSLFTFVILFTLILIDATARPVSAESLSVQIDPAFHHAIIEPGKSLSVNYTFTNLGDPNVYTFQLYRVTGHDELGTIELALQAETPINLELRQDGSRMEDAILMRTNEEITFTSRVTIPAGTQPGEYAFALVGRREAQPSQEGTITTRLTGGVGALLLLTVATDTEEVPDAQITEFSIGDPFHLSLFGADFQLFSSNEPIPITLRVANNGTHHIIPRGTIDIEPTVGSIESHPITPGYVLPEHTRLIQTLFYDQEACLQSYAQVFCSQPYSLVLPGYAFGVYEVTASVRFDIDGPSSYARQYIVVLPYQGIGIILLVILGFGLSLLPHWRRLLEEKKKETKRKVGLTQKDA